jgi:hypothetical protein
MPSRVMLSTMPSSISRWAPEVKVTAGGSLFSPGSVPRAVTRSPGPDVRLAVRQVVSWVNSPHRWVLLPTTLRTVGGKSGRRGR